MRILDIIIGWLLIAFGAVHISLTRRVHPSLDVDAIWFVTGGLFIITVGVLNLLRVAYSSVAKGIHVVSAIANLVFLLLMLLIASRFPMRGNPQVAIGLILAALLTAFSLFRRAGHIEARPGKALNRV